MVVNYGIIENAENLASKYQSANPFHHIVVDNFLDTAWANVLYHTIQQIPDDQWWKYDTPLEKKWAYDKLQSYGFFIDMNSPLILNYLEKLTGIHGLIPDPYFRGAGFHRINKGGHLDLHADFDRHPKLNLKRRLNVLIYLNKDYKPEYGGELELYDKHTFTKAKSIEPIFNRMVCFDTSDGAIHGHPSLWQSDVPRYSIALYYYTAFVQCHDCYEEPHSTIYYAQPGEPFDADKERLRFERAQFRPANYYDKK